ncbi:MAG: c-type cytochrome [Pirellulaceae bacterium]|nr:c-type cytochrome [Pirellulaceae bacterium]
MSRVQTTLALFAAVTFANMAAAQSPRVAPPSVESPISGGESLRHMHLTPGLRIELVAEEPNLVDPVAIRFDERGRMWAVEMRDYPNGPGPDETPKSRIKILEDRDQDGYYERATIFAEGLLFPTGMQPWNGGVIVTLAGEVAYFKDTDGDDQADLRETWYRGFAIENSQLRANHPTLGVDNQVYVANGLRGGAVVNARNPDAKPVSISGMDFRFDPLGGDHEAVSGVGQFGLTFDDYGNRFVCSNRNPVKHIVLQNHYLKRSPANPVAAIAHDVAAAGEVSRIYPISRAWTTSTLHAGQFTAACGVTMFRGDLLPHNYRGDAFTCDPTGNLVHREILTPAGASYQSRPAQRRVEFLASTDEWFRPVNMEVGPDGALYIVDMYRAVIEHPQWMPDELKTRLDMRYGDDRGRVYRVSAEANPSRSGPFDYAQASVVELASMLEHRNSWKRETAGRLLLERKDSATPDALVQLLVRTESAEGRIHALHLLQAHGALTQDLVRAALRDTHPRVREHGVKLAEKWRDEKAVADDLLKLGLADADARVRFQVAMSMAPIATEEGVAMLGHIGEELAEDVWTRRAVVISAGKMAPQLAERLAELTQTWPRFDDHRLALLSEVYAATALHADPQKLGGLAEAIKQLGEAAADRRPQQAALLALLRQGARRKINWQALLAAANDEDRAELQALAALTRKRAATAAEEIVSRQEAIRLLAFFDESVETLTEIALNDEQEDVRVAAIGSLGGTAPIEPWQEMVARFPSESPGTRRAILDQLLRNSARTGLLLDAIEAGAIKPAEIDQVRTKRLLGVRDEALKKRAAEILADAIPADRKQVLADFQVVLAMEADPARGRLVFQKHCASCHRIGNLGVDVAPDIADSRTRKPAQLLTDILQPNRAIDSNYVSYNALTVDGRIITGVLSAETSSSVTMRLPEGRVEVLSRVDIEELKSTGVSLMPVGLEKNINYEQMADLIAFIKNWRYLDGRTPLSE